MRLPRRSSTLAGRDLTLRIYEGARHGWNGEYTGVWFHRALNTS
ncbi:MAG TPA: hypothetical protein PK375_11630 [Rhodocyclaceae bacterium]|nr:hypothetical protein [Rhodocyclaceae bacterium]HNH36560.1 hypothetical protein [Rhodocyclaceae bacterium]